MATEWSGHMDFLNNIKFSGFEYDLVNVHKSRIDNEIFVNGAKWAHPREENTKSKLKKIKKSYKIPSEWAQSGEKFLKNNLSPEKVFEIYDNVLQDILS